MDRFGVRAEERERDERGGEAGDGEARLKEEYSGELRGGDEGGREGRRRSHLGRKQDVGESIEGLR